MEFRGPKISEEKDRKLLEDAQGRGRTDWSEIFYKPKAGDENLIRILPAVGPEKSKATYHLKAGKHFITHTEDGRTEMFICNRETYQEPCPACEKWDKLVKEGEKTAGIYKPGIFGAFNIVDYTNLEGGVKIWESPPVAVWEFIIGMVGGKSKFNNAVGTEENPLEGRDIIIMFNPKAHPQHMYKLQFDAPSVIKARDAKKWLEQATELLPENLYPKVDYEVAKIKAFGSAEEREELRKKLREQAQARAREAEPKGETTEEAVTDAEEDDEVAKAKKVLADAEAKKAEKEKEKEKEPEDEVAKAERILAEAKKKKAEEAGKVADKPAEKPKEEEKKKDETDVADDARKKVEAIRKKHAAE